MKSSPLLLTFFLAAAFHSPSGAQEQVIDTQSEGHWSSVPFDFLQGKKQDLVAAEKGDRRMDWERPPITMAELTAGVKFSRDASGTGMLKWQDHPLYPSIGTQAVPADWSGSGSLSITCYSQQATGETVTVGVLADNPATPYEDYWAVDFKVDWEGLKKIDLPLAGFEKQGEPDWKHVAGLYFFSKAKRNSPSPQTVLCFQTIKLVPVRPGSVAAQTGEAGAAPQGDVFFNPLTARTYDAPVVLNHRDPEILSNIAPGRPITEQFFYRGVRALYGYNPRYNPGYVSIDPQGRACLRSLTAIDWLDAAGKWVEKDLLPPVRDYCRQNHWEAFTIGCNDADMTVRFDSDGDVYVLVQLRPLDRAGKDKNWHDRTALLLHARGLNQPWEWYHLPAGRTADFEKLDGHNRDALSHPPVIVLGDYMYNKEADQQCYLLLPEKKADGTLQFPKPLPIGVGSAEQLLMGPVHEGRGNFVISHGDKVFVAYGSAPQASDPKNMWAKPRDPQWLASLHIPADHPANKLMLEPYKGREIHSSDGLPTFVRVYDRKTAVFSDPVFIGYGGKFLDVHNWPALTIDSRGILHVILSGHCDQALYTHTLKPDDITQWSAPAFVMKGPDSADFCHASYPSLTCDEKDNLLYVFRSDTGVYDHRLSAISKKAGSETWDNERSILVPVIDGYHAWEHALTYDSVSRRHYLSFLEGWRPVDTQDHNSFARFIYPFAQFPAWRVKEAKTAGAIPEDSEATVLISDDGGKIWRIATTPDFQNQAARN